MQRCRVWTHASSHKSVMRNVKNENLNNSMHSPNVYTHTCIYTYVWYANFGCACACIGVLLRHVMPYWWQKRCTIAVCASMNVYVWVRACLCGLIHGNLKRAARDYCSNKMPADTCLHTPVYVYVKAQCIHLYACVLICVHVCVYICKHVHTNANLSAEIVQRHIIT